jgi:parvulin-like peptidyl-prolyl isomerase
LKEQKATVHRAAKQFAILILVAALAVSLVACNRDKGSQSNKDVAATVNGKNLLLKDVDQRVNQRAGGQMAQLSTLQLAAARLQELDGLIQQEVLFQRAEKDKLVPTEDDITRTINTKKQEGRLTEEDYQRQLSETGQTEQTLREAVRKEMAIQRLQEKIVGNISISEREVQEAYEKNKETFVNRRGVALAAIIVDPRDNGLQQDDAKNPAEAVLKINNISQQLKSGNSDFATIARQRSEDNSAQFGGDIGVASEDQLKQTGFTPDLITKFFSGMQVGNFTEPTQTSDGRWAIFKLTDRNLENRNQTYEEVKTQIKEALIGQRRQLLNVALLTTAMNEAKIENKLAGNILTDPSMLGGLQPAQPAGAGATPTTPGAASPSPSAPVTASPAAATTPPAAGATASPAAAASPQTK